MFQLQEQLLISKELRALGLGALVTQPRHITVCMQCPATQERGAAKILTEQDSLFKNVFQTDRESTLWNL